VTQGSVSPVPREARPFQGEAAGVVTRLIANTIDGALVVVLLVGGYLGFNGVLFLLDPRGFQFTGASVFKSVATASVAMLLYFTVTWATTGRTYGDHVMGLRVVNRHRRRVRPLAALIRAALCIIFPIGLLWCAVSRSRRSVQDELLRTWVIYEWLPRHDLADSELLPDAPEARA
jgi:uncharacterized RDD family membrane protein YckC